MIQIEPIDDKPLMSKILTSLVNEKTGEDWAYPISTNVSETLDLIIKGKFDHCVISPIWRENVFNPFMKYILIFVNYSYS